MNSWRPMRDPLDLKHLGKLGEELGECSAAVSRCIIQGINESEPFTGKSNRIWLQDEIADVIANIDLVVAHFGLDYMEIQGRVGDKKRNLRLWHLMAADD